MRAIIQRVSRASVDVAGARVGEIGRGFLVLLGVMAGDTDTDRKSAEQGKNHSNSDCRHNSNGNKSSGSYEICRNK